MIRKICNMKICQIKWVCKIFFPLAMNTSTIELRDPIRFILDVHIYMNRFCKCIFFDIAIPETLLEQAILLIFLISAFHFSLVLLIKTERGFYL